MKKYFLFACVAAALVSCSSDDFLGNESGLTQQTETGAILFQAGNLKATRADHVGADAANLLNNKFTVEGSKTVNGTASEVFDDYLVNWKANTAGTTESNTADWEYVGLTAVAPSSIVGNAQSIKYWDYSASQYDFAAYSTGTATAITSGDPTDGQVLVSAIDYNNLSTAAYTIKGKTADLAKVYISDLVTAYKANMTPAQPKFQEEVTFKFRNLASKARVALYETVPGYSVKDVKFYTTDDGTNTDLGTATATSATLFTTGSGTTDKFFTNGTYTVNFPTIGSSNVAKDDYNKAHVAFTAATSGTSTTQAWGSLNYSGVDYKEAAGKYLGRTSAEASFAGTGDFFTTVLPNETGTVLELRVDYTLVSIDGSGEEIKVYGAKALVPAKFAAWKSNYAYTYLFKISDGTNGWTSKVPSDPAGLFPITFDAVVLDAVDGAEQTTITTVATPSITTYQKGHLYTVDHEYNDGDIYVQVMQGGNLKNLAEGTPAKGQLYTLSGKAAGASYTEAEVMAALNMGSVDGTTKVVTGRNGVVLTPATSDATIEAIPGVDGNDISVTAGQAATFNASASTIYAYVYDYTTGTVTPEDIYTYDADVSLQSPDPTDWATTYTNYYTTVDGITYTPATTTYNNKAYYYAKYTNNNKLYAVKVIVVK